MEIVTHPSALPATCCFCPGSVRDRYIDTGVQYEFYGAFYLCDECVLNMGRMIGMISQDQAEVLIRKNADEATANYELRKKLAALEAGLHGLVDAGYISPLALGDAGLSHSSERSAIVLHEATDGDEVGFPASEGFLGSGEGTSPEQSDDEGVGIVHTDDGSDAGSFTI